MEINVIDKGRNFFGILHFVVIDSTNSLVCASIGGLESTVTAITSAIIERRRCNISLDSSRTYQVMSDGDYRRIIKKQDQTFHGLIFHKAMVFEEDYPNPIIFAEDGNIPWAVGNFLSKKHALPKEWVNKYYNMLPEDCIEPLEVHTHHLALKYADLKAVRLSDQITEDFLLDEIDQQLKDGRLIIPAKLGNPVGKFDPSWDTKEYLTENTLVLAAQLDVMQPRFDPNNQYHKIDKNLGLMNRIPFPTQAMVIQGTVNAMTSKDNPERTIFCGGDMGTGKSISALGVTHLLHQRAIANGKNGYRVLLVAPGITIPKWIDKEIKETLPWAKVTTISNQKDAITLLKKAKTGQKAEGLEIVILGTDRAKLGPDPWCGALWKRVAGEKFHAWHCPDCMKPLPDPHPDADAKEIGDILADWNDLAFGDIPDKSLFIGGKNLNGIPSDYPLRWKKRSQLRKCPACQSKLWRPSLKARGESINRPRWFISKILKKMGKYFDLMIQDEVHQTKAQDSGRGSAFAHMVKTADNVLMLTGTLVNGKSTSIKEILWRTDPKALLDNGFDHKTGMVQWAGRYGVLKKVTITSEVDTGVSTQRKKTEMQPTEEPGISPSMTTEYLLHKTAFMELGDLGLPLIEKKEIPVFLDMDKEHEQEYKSFHETLFSACKEKSRFGGKGAWSKFLPSVLNYADRPDLGASVLFNDEDVVTAPAFDPDYLTTKERWLVNTIKAELAEDRGVVIYNKYTDGYALNDRIQHILKRADIESDILKSNTSPEKRVEWLADREEKGRKVLICNMRLVEVGLDLLPWPTIIFYQLDYDINIVRQAGARSWRIGQHRECRTYFPILNETQQVAQFQNIMTKRAHALMVEGRLDRSELAQFGRDAHNAMASDLASCLAGANLTNHWQSLAQKDIDANLKIVSEKEFKNAVANAITRLHAETMKLCGVTDTERQAFIKKENAPSKKEQVVVETKQADLFSIDFFSEENDKNDSSMVEIDFSIPLVVIEKPATGRRKKHSPSVGQLGFAW